MGAMFIQTPNGAERVGGGGGGGVNVTASVGQTIVVKEVDANGKPTKWEAADYQPRTHWSEETVLMPEQEAMARADGAFIFDKSGELTFQAGKRYQVTLNGVVYESVAKDFGGGVVFFGNIEFASPIGEPYYGVYVHDADSGEDGAALIVLDQGEATMIASLAEVKHTPIPVQYVSNALPYYVDLTIEYYDDGGFKNITCAETVAELTGMVNAGRSIIVRKTDYLAESDLTEEVLYYLAGRYIDPTGISLFEFASVASGDVLHPRFTFSPNEDGTYSIEASHH